MGLYGVEEQFFLWICHHAKSILADPAYQRLKQLEEISGSACRGDQVDPGRGLGYCSLECASGCRSEQVLESG